MEGLLFPIKGSEFAELRSALVFSFLKGNKKQPSLINMSQLLYKTILNQFMRLYEIPIRNIYLHKMFAFK